ncbi:MAG: hypothetical protein EKK55_02290 [Rhodocyclaceae bacterium]|nr:MAG: hypothetical protein EKK55_02290 [Rhodocyclaceae bacterium]
MADPDFLLGARREFAASASRALVEEIEREGKLENRALTRLEGAFEELLVSRGGLLAPVLDAAEQLVAPRRTDAERILLVTGSRALGESPAALNWARDEIRWAVERERATRVVAGDARGGDAAARSVAEDLGLPFECWHLDALVRVWRGPDDSKVVRSWWPEASHRLPASSWPISRNTAMVASVAARAANRDAATTLALIAPWSKSRGLYGGTRHTIRACEHAGVLVLPVLTCPAELGPKGRAA